MIGISGQTQSSGDNSNNIQAKTVTIINPDEGTIRSIVDRQIEARLSLLTGEAFQTYKVRCNDFTDGLVAALKTSFSPHIDRLREPSVQFSINEAQKAYGESGEENIKETLITLVGKMCSAPSNILDRVYKDAIDIVRKLNSRQLNLLSLHVVMYNLSVETPTFNDWMSWLISMTQPFLDDLPKNKLEIQHLDHIGVGSYQVGSANLRGKLLNEHIGIFQKGFALDDLDETLKDDEIASKYFIQSMHTDHLLQLRFTNHNQLASSVADAEIRAKLSALLNSRMMNHEEMDAAIAPIYPRWRQLVEYATKYQLDNFHVSSVGQALAVINVETKCKTKIGIDVWLEEDNAMPKTP